MYKNNDWDSLCKKTEQKDFRSLSRLITLVENEVEGYFEVLKKIQLPQATPVIGITGAPGSGKSSLLDRIIEYLTKQQKQVAVLCVDPSSPFHHGAILGDRIRMLRWSDNPNVFIRSLSSRGSLGGLHPKIYEILDVVQLAKFDYIFIETVGVGQNEVDIVQVASPVMVVLVPESGDMIQNLKAGLMEIGDMFVVNKADREGATLVLKNVKEAIHFQAKQKEIPILSCSALNGEGIEPIMQSLLDGILKQNSTDVSFDKLHQKALRFIHRFYVDKITKSDLKKALKEASQKDDFHFYTWLENFIREHEKK